MAQKGTVLITERDTDFLVEFGIMDLIPVTSGYYSDEFRALVQYQADEMGASINMESMEWPPIGGSGVWSTTIAALEFGEDSFAVQGLKAMTITLQPAFSTDSQAFDLVYQARGKDPQYLAVNASSYTVEIANGVASGSDIPVEGAAGEEVPVPAAPGFFSTTLGKVVGIGIGALVLVGLLKPKKRY